jgi:hypothetical protein
MADFKDTVLSLRDQVIGLQTVINDKMTNLQRNHPEIKDAMYHLTRVRRSLEEAWASGENNTE